MKGFIGSAAQQVYAVLLSAAGAAVTAIMAALEAGMPATSELGDPQNLVVWLVLYLLTRGFGWAGDALRGGAGN